MNPYESMYDHLNGRFEWMNPNQRIAFTGLCMCTKIIELMKCKKNTQTNDEKITNLLQY